MTMCSTRPCRKLASAPAVPNQRSDLGKFRHLDGTILGATIGDHNLPFSGAKAECFQRAREIIAAVQRGDNNAQHIQAFILIIMRPEFRAKKRWTQWSVLVSTYVGWHIGRFRGVRLRVQRAQ